MAICWQVPDRLCFPATPHRSIPMG
jgi:hypothetical protein